MSLPNRTEPAVELLAELGFTTNQARAYVGLLQESPATGYELAARAGVPRSAIYGVLKQLEEQGVLARVGEQPARYVALPSDELVARLAADFRRRTAKLEEALSDLSGPSPVGALWRVRGYDAILQRAAAFIDGAEHSVYLAAWSSEVQRLAGSLAAARERGVSTILFSFCPLPPGLGTVHSYDLPPERLEEFWPHRLVLVADRERCLMGGAQPGGANTAAVTSDDPEAVANAIHTIAMDITLLAQRRGLDASETMAEMLRDRLGRLDELFEG